MTNNANLGFTRYWVLTTEGDPIRVGSGFRGVDVKIVHSWVYIRGPSDETSERIRLPIWEAIPHVEDTGQPLAAVLMYLRGDNLTPHDL